MLSLCVLSWANKEKGTKGFKAGKIAALQRSHPQGWGWAPAQRGGGGSRPAGVRGERTSAYNSGRGCLPERLLSGDLLPPLKAAGQPLGHIRCGLVAQLRAGPLDIRLAVTHVAGPGGA